MASDGVFIRKGTIADVIVLGELWGRMSKEAYPEHEPDIDFWKGQYLCHMSAMNDDYAMVVAEHDEKVVGFVDAYIFYCPFISKIRGHILGTYILPDFRGSTAVPRLMHRLRRQHIAQKVEWLEFVCPPALLESYIKKGFRLMSHLMVHRPYTPAAALEGD